MIERLAVMAVLLAACAGQPARFADRDPVTRVADELPIPLPRDRSFIDEFHQADVYVRRELVGGMDPRRPIEALDVSSLDEVPRSSWFRPPRDANRPLEGYERSGPPVPPFVLTGEAPSSGMPGAVAIRDARGLAYELVSDPKGRPRMRSGAIAIASRLLHAVGYLVPEAHVVRSPDGERVVAVRWPVGVDLGPTRIGATRGDDPNDRLPHLDRRSLRALTHVTGWLGMKRLRARALRDVYVGVPGKGHVEHWLVGIDGALGVDDYLDALNFALDPDRESSNFFLRVFTLGLSPKPYALPPVTEWPSVGLLNQVVLEDHLDPSPPFEPLDRLTAPDAYWAAKRLAALPPEVIIEAVRAGDLEPEPHRWLIGLLNRRRATVIALGYDRTTPCEVVAVEGRRLLLADLAVQGGFVTAARTSYLVRYLDPEGAEVEPSRLLASPDAFVAVPLPSGAPYLIARVLAMRFGLVLRRRFEAHLVPDGSGYRLIGVRH